MALKMKQAKVMGHNVHITIDPTEHHEEHQAQLLNQTELTGAQSWELYHRLYDVTGYLIGWAIMPDHYELPLKETFNTCYQHGGGWQPMKGFTIDDDTGVMSYPDDPDLYPIMEIRRGNELCYIYQHAFVSIRGDKGWETARMD